MKQGKPLKRTPFRSKPLRQHRRDGADMEREPKPWAVALASATLRPLTSARMGGSTSGVSITKEPPTRPGKRTPTKDERAWMDAIVAYGCIACRMDGLGIVPPAVHHILSGGRRIGHLSTLPLCDPGHHQNGQRFGMLSRHPWKAQFEQRYGSEDHLLAHLQGVLKKQPDGSYAPC